MQTIARYAMSRPCALSFEEADRRIREALKNEGFGVLTEIDVQATLRAKLGLEIAPYRILGACNPALASQAIAAEPDVGLLLPCNVVVRTGARGETIVEALDPVVQLEIAHNDQLHEIAAQVKARLVRALEQAVKD